MWQILDPKTGRRMRPERYQLDFATSPARATLASGGWGSGKTFAEFLFIAVSAELAGPNSIGIVVLPTYPHMSKWLREGFLPAFRPYIRAHNKAERIITLEGNRQIYYQSATDPESLQITSADWAVIDEGHLMPAEIWRHVVGRVRGHSGQPGTRRIGVVSLPKIGWLSDEFHRPEYEGTGTDARRLLYFETAWNSQADADYIEDLRASCPASMLDAYLRGRFVPAGGSVWPEFSEARHVVPWVWDEQILSADGFLTRTGITLSIDWSPRVPHVQFWHRLPAGIRLGNIITQHDVAVLVDELYPDGMLQAVTTERLCHLIRTRAAEKRYRIDRIVCDPAGSAAQSTSGESDMTIANRELGVPIVGAGHPVSVGISHVQWALDPLIRTDKRGRTLNHPRLFISRDLVDHPYDSRRAERSTFRAIKAYSYKEVRKGRPVDREPVKDGVADHACDTTRYFVYDAWPQDRLAVDIREVA